MWNMRPIIQSTLLACVIGLFLSACSIDTVDSQDVNETRLYGSYSLHYSAEDLQMSYRVEFREGSSSGNTVRLNHPSQIRVDGRKLDEHSFLGTYYLSEQYLAPNEVVDSYTFEWTRHDGGVYRNRVYVPEPVAVTEPRMGVMHSRAASLVIRFTGAPIGPEELVELTISGRASGTLEGSQFLKKTVTHGDRIRVSSYELQDFANGDINISVERRLQQPNPFGHDKVGGTVTSYYQSRIVTVELVD